MQIKLVNIIILSFTSNKYRQRDGQVGKQADYNAFACECVSMV